MESPKGKTVKSLLIAALPIAVGVVAGMWIYKGTEKLASKYLTKTA